MTAAPARIVALLLSRESVADVGAVDPIMDGISPQRDGWGKRVSMDVHEVMFDRRLALHRAA